MISQSDSENQNISQLEMILGNSAPSVRARDRGDVFLFQSITSAKTFETSTTSETLPQVALGKINLQILRSNP